MIITIKAKIKELGWVSEDCNHLAGDKSMVMNFKFLQKWKGGNFFAK
jgi:hypothetical protein